MEWERAAAALLLLVSACAADPVSPCRDCADGRPAADEAAGADPTAPGDGDGIGMDGDAFICGAGTEVTLDRLWPEPGELFYVQLGLNGAIAMGESALMVFPAGQIVAVDVGNDSHADDVAGMVSALVAEMSGRGFDPRAAAIDEVLLTHLHADHTDGLEGVWGAVPITGRVIWRGFYDLVGVDEDTVGSLCDALAAHPGKELPLCTGAAAAACGWTAAAGTFPATICSGAAAASRLRFSATTGIDIIGVDGWMNGESYAALVQPFLTETNGENARSPVAVVEHGAFRLLLNGDLTGGGSDTDPVEGFYIPRIGLVSDIDDLGVDVLHAGHHGRNTSTSMPWADRLLPKDGRSRNVIMAVSEAHVRSPYQEVIDAIFDENRLAAGYGWTTRVALLGTTHARLLDAGGGHLLVRTFAGGRGYYLQGVSTSGAVLWTRRYDSVRACP